MSADTQDFVIEDYFQFDNDTLDNTITNTETNDNDWQTFDVQENNKTDFEEELFAGIFGTLLIGFIFVMIVISIISIISMWKIFTKAGQEGWKSIIPIYNNYVLFELTGLKGWYVFLSFIPFVGSAIMLVFNILCDIKLSRSFGKDTGFAIGLIFLPIIFLPILAFDNSTYIGPDGNPNLQPNL